MPSTGFVVVVLCLTALVSLGAFVSARVLHHLPPQQNLLLLPSENIARLVFIAGCLLLGLWSGLPPTQLGWQLAPVWPQLAMGTLSGLGVGLAVHRFTAWLIRRTGYRFYSPRLLVHIAPRNRRELIWVSLVMVLVVFSEELLFRSLLLGGLAPRFPLVLLVVVTSMLFGVLHITQGWWGMIAATLAGFVLSVLFVWQQSLLTPFIAHYLNNWLQIFLHFRQGSPLLPTIPVSNPPSD